MAISICCVSASAALFTDVSDSFWASKEIAWAVDKGVVNGTSATTFSPNDKTLRGQMSLILYRYAGEPAVNGASSYSDVKPTVYYANAASWTQKNNILISTVSGSNQFLGDTPISRAEFCAMIYNYAGYKSVDRETASAAPFSDVNGLSSELTTAINWAYANGIVNGVDGNRFAPNDTLTRAQAVVILYRYENKFASGSGSELNPGTETNPTPEIPVKPDGTTKTYDGSNLTSQYKTEATGVLGSYFEVNVPVGQRVFFRIPEKPNVPMAVHIKDGSNDYSYKTDIAVVGVDILDSGSIMVKGTKTGTMVAYLFKSGEPDGTLSTVVIHVGGSTSSISVTTPSGASANPSKPTSPATPSDSNSSVSSPDSITLTNGSNIDVTLERGDTPIIIDNIGGNWTTSQDAASKNVAVITTPIGASNAMLLALQTGSAQIAIVKNGQTIASMNVTVVENSKPGTEVVDPNFDYDSVDFNANMDIRNEIIRLTNEVRKENGVAELPTDSAMMNAAQAAAEYYAMSGDGWNGHNTKVEDQCCEDASVIYQEATSGVMANLTGFSRNNRALVAKEAVNNWVNSKGHFQSMILPDYINFGIGVAVDADGYYWCVQFFN